MFPFRYNNGVQIIQTPGYVILNLEMIHEARIIPVDGRPGISPVIKQWMGESRGRWEGNTLVITTTNFKAGASATNIGVAGSPAGNRFPTSEQMKITERFKRLNAEMLLYEITTEDPVVLTRPWTARFPLRLDKGYEWWEYACHEGNRTIPDYVNTSRAERAPNALLRRGWNKKSLTEGTAIIVEGFRAKDGTNRANGRDIVFPDGKKLFVGSSGTGAPDERPERWSDLVRQSGRALFRFAPSSTRVHHPARPPRSAILLNRDPAQDVEHG